VDRHVDLANVAIWGEDGSQMALDNVAGEVLDEYGACDG
jgi:hypothetical protein